MDVHSAYTAVLNCQMGKLIFESLEICKWHLYSNIARLAVALEMLTLYNYNWLRCQIVFIKLSSVHLKENENQERERGETKQIGVI